VVSVKALTTLLICSDSLGAMQTLNPYLKSQSRLQPWKE